MATEAQPDTLWLTGAGFYRVYSADFATEQCITQTALPDTGFSHNANHGFIRDETVKLLQQVLA
jgi:hypothetical protein